ncbi:two-component system, OmpR family, sensor kinase [Massilia yuzhufengensis]|uniref:histidine kinase n=1 Tax=Massilia yuzhufengensis TaxID=1164594 RepID=A0A1I1P4Z7_9BURK|nr:two-component system, OmpR family, sensor kinase [Massilia yuzhufengensis]
MQDGHVNRIFFRFFVLVMLSITAATFVIYFAFSRLFGDPLDDIARRQAAAQIFLLEQYVDKAATDDWLTRLNNVREVSEVRYDLIALGEARSALPDSRRAALDRGEIVLDPSSRSFYRRVDLEGERYIGSHEEVLRAQNLPVDVKQALIMEALRYIIVAVALLVPIALWSRSHWQGLQSLSRVADEFGSGKLTARSQMKPSASIYPLAERINHMADRIEDLLEAQKSLLHSVSHELRTPIARLEFALELLDARAKDPDLSRRIGAMEGDLRELNSLVNELLDMSKLESARNLQAELAELAPVLRGCTQMLPPSPQQLDCTVPDDLGELEIDARLLARAVCNLLRNAQKYAAGRIVLSASRSDGAVEIAVDDDGPGIPDEEREKIFDPFYRLDRSRDRATGGFGLGLSIARKAVALHGGSLRAEGSPLGGARFVITLPV